MDLPQFKKGKSIKRASNKPIRRVLGESFSTLLYEDNYYISYKNNIIPIEFDSNIIHITNLFSTEKNTNYELYTIKHYPNSIKFNLIELHEYWTPLIEGLIVKGIIKNNVFIINIDYLNRTVDKLFKKQMNEQRNNRK